MTKSEDTVAKAKMQMERGDMVKALKTLTQYADRGVNNRRTAEIFYDAIEEEFGGVGTQFDMVGVNLPYLKACPECGNRHLSAIFMDKYDGSVMLDGEGGVEKYHEYCLMDVGFSSLRCTDCGEILIEGGEVIDND